MHPHSLLVTTTNGAGIGIQCVYILMFIIYLSHKKRIMVLVLLAEIIFLAILVIVILILDQRLLVVYHCM